MNYARALKIIRAVLGISQQEFAYKLNVSKSLISFIESGDRELSKSVMESIERTFFIPIEVIQLLASADNNKVSVSEKQKIGGLLLQIATNNNE